MNETGKGAPAPAAEVFPNENAQPKTLKGLLGETSFQEWIASIRSGLNMPKDSGEYKYAVQQVKRLWSPVCGIVLPLLLVLIVMLSPEPPTTDHGSIPVTIEPTKPTEVLKDDPKDKPEPPEPVEPPPPDDSNLRPEVGDPNNSMPGPSSAAGPAAGPSTPFSPQPASFDSVAIVKSAVTMKGVYASRSPGAKGRLTGRGGAGGGGDGKTEEAVMRALRWLKKNQQSNGSWGQQTIAMTGLSILTFLAHGEKPGESAEFGPTVQKALEFLLAQATPDGRFKGCDGHEYALPIATYAICEAYGMTMNPNVKEAAEKSIATIIKGQNASGGFNYNLKPCERDDTSYMGWCAQALKAGKMAGIHVEGLEKAIKQSVQGFKKNAGQSGGFGYVGPAANNGMTSVGTLCMQLLGAAGEKEVKMSLDIMDSWTPSFEDKQAGIGGGSLQYYFYYATQCKYHAGGPRWISWNTMMKKVYIPAMKVTSKESSGYVDHTGKPQDIGWWENMDHHTDRPVMDTCLGALQLMVYYRYLPTTSAAAMKVEEEISAKAPDTNDIKVNTGNL